MAQPVFYKEQFHNDPASANDVRYFSFVEAQKAQCTGCGQCCRSWNISIEPDRADRVEAYYRTRGLAPADKVLFERKDSPSPDEVKIKNTFIVLNQDGVCPFLEEDKKCGIHRYLGYEAKGTTCQVFPKQPMYIEGIGGFDGLFFSSNYMLDLLFSDKPLDMVSIGGGTMSTAISEHFDESNLSPSCLIVLFRAYSPYVHKEPQAWKAAMAWTLLTLQAEKEAAAGDPPRQWNSAKADRVVKEVLANVEGVDAQASTQMEMIHLLAASSFTDKAGGGITLPVLAELFRGRDGEPSQRPNLVFYHRVMKKQLPVLDPVFNRVYRRFIAFKNYGLTFLSVSGMKHGPWMMLFHMALARTLACILLEKKGAETPEDALRQAIFGLERDFLHNSIRVREVCNGELKEFLTNPLAALLLAKPA